MVRISTRWSRDNSSRTALLPPGIAPSSDTSPPAQNAAARAGEHDRPDAFVRPDPPPAVDELTLQLEVGRVQLVGPVEGEHGDHASVLEEHACVGIVVERCHRGPGMLRAAHPHLRPTSPFARPLHWRSEPEEA